MAEKRRFRMPPLDDGGRIPDDFQHSSDEFVIPATDEQGESQRCQFRCPGMLHGWMGDIVASRKFPFQRDGDLMRYGLYSACLTLSRIEKAVPSLQARLEVANAALRRRANMASVLDHISKLAVDIEDLRRKEAWGEIVYILAGERRHAEIQAETEPYWGNRWLETLHDQFDHIHDKAMSKLDTISLMPKLGTNTDGAEIERQARREAELGSQGVRGSSDQSDSSTGSNGRGAK